MKTVCWVVAIGMVSSACGGDPTSTPVEEERDDTIDDVHFDVPDDDGPVDGEVVIVPEDPIWCLPEAVPYDLTQLPAVPLGFDGANFCDATGLTHEDAVPTHLHTFDPTLNVLEVAGVQLLGPGDARVTYTFDELGRVRELYREGVEGWYAVSSGSTWYQLNERGELERKLSSQLVLVDPEAAESVIETVQTWDGDRLLSREVRSGEDGPLVRQTQWEYDAEGRLLLAELSDRSVPDDERIYSTRWQYNDAGLPILVERRVDDHLVEREAWSFDGTGALVSRSYESVSLDTLTAEQGRDRWQWQFVGGLDSYERPVDDVFMQDPWLTALPIASGDCFQLPRGPGHGYPDAEAEYQLGVPRDGRPTGIGFAYGNASYGWRYGDVAWYGHDGLGSGWYGNPLSNGTSDLEGQVTYGAGRMVSEQATVTLTGGSSVAFARTRTLVEGQVAADRLVVADEVGEGAERELRFERDSAGLLIGRELVVGDEVVARQTWERDDVGRALRHVIEAAELSSPLGVDGWEAAVRGFGDGAIDETSYYWRYAGERLVERGGGPAELHETRTYDEQGRLVEVSGSFDTWDTSGSERWTYDDADRVVELCTSYDEITWTCTNTVFDEVGRVAWRESSRGDEAPVLVQYIQYDCAP